MEKSRRSPRKFDFWAGHVLAWRSSGLTQVGYCDKHGLGTKSFGRWKNKLSKSTDAKRASPFVMDDTAVKTLIPINLVEEPPGFSEQTQLLQAPTAILLRVAGTFEIDVLPDFNAATLKRLIQVLVNRD